MLNDNEIKKIKQLIKQGKSDYRIGKDTHHSPNTSKRIREEGEKSEEKQTKTENIEIKSATDIVRGAVEELEAQIQTKKLEVKEEKKIMKLVEPLRKIIKEEVDDRILQERADAIRNRDEYWQRYIQQNYVTKDEAANLEKTIQEKDTINISLRKTIEELEKEIKEIQSANDALTSYNLWLENQNHDLVEKYQKSENKVWMLQNYIDNRLDSTVARDLEQLKNEQNELDAKKIVIEANLEIKRSDLNAFFLELERKQKNLDVREKQLVEWEEKIQKREDEFNANKNLFYNTLQEGKKAVENRANEVFTFEKKVKIWAEEQFNKINNYNKNKELT